MIGKSIFSMTNAFCRYTIINQTPYVREIELDEITLPLFQRVVKIVSDTILSQTIRPFPMMGILCGKNADMKETTRKDMSKRDANISMASGFWRAFREIS